MVLLTKTIVFAYICRFKCNNEPVRALLLIGIKQAITLIIGEQAMALLVKVQKMKKNGQPDKWYGKAVKRQDVTLQQIAQMISMSNSVTESDVYGVLKALVHEMKYLLQMGHTVKLDGFGNFHLTIESEMVDDKKDYRLDEHVKRVKCKFTPASHRVTGGKLSYYFCEGVELERK